MLLSILCSSEHGAYASLGKGCAFLDMMRRGLVYHTGILSVVATDRLFPCTLYDARRSVVESV
jgi:hypothetical protein